MVLVVTKIDLNYQSTVENFEAEELSHELGLNLMMTSSKENTNIYKVFHHLAVQCLKEISSWSEKVSYIQIGRGTFRGLSPSDFLIQYENEEEENEKDRSWQKMFLRKKSKLLDENFHTGAEIFCLSSNIG